MFHWMPIHDGVPCEAVRALTPQIGVGLECGTAGVEAVSMWDSV
jgi:hypothetical protein